MSLRFFGAKRDGKWALLEKITVIRSFFVDFSIMVHLPSRIGQKSIKNLCAQKRKKLLRPTEKIVFS